MVDCIPSAAGRRNLFWATQPDAGGSFTHCDGDCGYPGFVQDGSSLVSTDWLRGLIINMLMTDGKEPDTRCGYTAGAQGGHWSESYMTGAAVVGTLIRSIGPQGRVTETTALLKAYAQSTLDRLIERGVASTVECTVAYKGVGRFALDVEVRGVANDLAKVGLTGERLTNGWIWGK